MKKINISFITYAGLSYGGAHRQSMNLAKILDKNIFNVRYFWCKHNKDKFSNFSFPEINLGFLEDLKKSGVETIEFDVPYRDISNKYHPWIGTDFFEVFDNYETDIVFAVKSGTAEFPFIHINKPIIEWNVFGGVDDSDNLIYSVAVSPWVRNQYLNKGGKKEGGYCFYGFDLPKNLDNKKSLREKNGIADEEIAIGFHQRKDDNIFAEHALRSWKNVYQKTNKKLKFFVLGGSEKYKSLAKELKLDVKFLPIVSEYKKVSDFLRTLDIYSHSAGLGESLGISIQEAMAHSLPIVSMYGQNNGHIDVIGDTIEIALNREKYEEILLELINDENKRNEVSNRSYLRAKEYFSSESMKKYFEELFLSEYKKFNNNPKNFKIKKTDIYNRISIRTLIYRIFFYFPPLMRFTHIIWPKVRNFVNKN